MKDKDITVGKINFEMKSTNDIVLEYMDRSNEADDMEALIADIKSTLESPFYSDEFKLKTIRKSIIDYGY